MLLLFVVFVSAKGPSRKEKRKKEEKEEEEEEEGHGMQRKEPMGK